MTESLTEEHHNTLVLGWMQLHLGLLGGVVEERRRQNEEAVSREEGQPPRKLSRVVGDIKGVEGGFVDTLVVPVGPA